MNLLKRVLVSISRSIYIYLNQLKKKKEEEKKKKKEEERRREEEGRRKE